MSVPISSRAARLTALATALLTLCGCSTDLTVDASIHLAAQGEATLRFHPIPPVGTIALRNTGPDRAHLEFFGPSPDHPALFDRMLTIELGPGGSILQSISGVQRIEATTRGDQHTTIYYTIRSREGVGYVVDLGQGAIGIAGTTLNEAEPEANPDSENR